MIEDGYWGRRGSKTESKNSQRLAMLMGTFLSFQPLVIYRPVPISARKGVMCPCALIVASSPSRGRPARAVPTPRYLPLMKFITANQCAACTQDNLDQMTTGASNIIFLIMWPIFSLMLVCTPAADARPLLGVGLRLPLN